MLGVEAWAELVECVFDFLATPSYEPDAELLATLLLHLARLQKENPPDLVAQIQQVFIERPKPVGNSSGCFPPVFRSTAQGGR